MHKYIYEGAAKVVHKHYTKPTSYHFQVNNL